MSGEVSICRSCGAGDPLPFLDLGETPLADALIAEADLAAPEPRFPLAVAFCPECALVQTTRDVPPAQLFVDNYLYFSSFSDELLAHARSHALNLVELRNLDERSLVVEIGSNDGYLLRSFAERGIPVLGIDPAPGQAAAAETAGIPTLTEFFDVDVARRLVAAKGRADVIVANNVMAHTPDLNGFVAGLRLLVADDGLITIENAYVRDLIDRVEFDTIYHEHFCYFSTLAVDAAMRRHDLVVRRVEHLGIHGGSLRWSVAPFGAPDETVVGFLDAERQAGLDRFAYYAGFAAQVQTVAHELRTLLEELRRSGRRVAAYGAAAKGATLLNVVGIGPDLVEFVVDRNVHKQGRFMPGVRLPIRDPAALVEEQPDYVLLLAWNFRDEIAAQQSEYRSRGGRFIVPVPAPTVV